MRDWRAAPHAGSHRGGRRCAHREGLMCPGALADPTHPVQEEAALWRGQNPKILADCHAVVILPCKMTTWLHTDRGSVAAGSPKGCVTIRQGQPAASQAVRQRLQEDGRLDLQIVGRAQSPMCDREHRAGERAACGGVGRPSESGQPDPGFVVSACARCLPARADDGLAGAPVRTVRSVL